MNNGNRWVFITFSNITFSKDGIEVRIILIYAPNNSVDRSYFWEVIWPLLNFNGSLFL